MNVVSEAVVTVDNTVKTNVPGLRDFTFIVIFSDGLSFEQEIHKQMLAFLEHVRCSAGTMLFVKTSIISMITATDGKLCKNMSVSFKHKVYLLLSPNVHIFHVLFTEKH
jgi:hypothetical protein